MKHRFSSSILKALLFLVGVPGLAQSQSPIILPLHIFPGDGGFSSSSVWPAPTMQWGPRFTYTTPTLPAGIYQVTLNFQEIPGGAITGPGQRLFTVSWLGQTSRPIDLWSISGTDPVQIVGRIYLSFPGPVVVTFSASIRNAMVSEIDIDQGSLTPNVFVPSADVFQNIPCPTGWTGPRLLDGNCLAVIFSQPQK